MTKKAFFLVILLITVSLSGCLRDGKGDRNDEMITYEPGPTKFWRTKTSFTLVDLPIQNQAQNHVQFHLCWTSIVRTQTQQTDRS